MAIEIGQSSSIPTDFRGWIEDLISPEFYGMLAHVLDSIGTAANMNLHQLVHQTLFHYEPRIYQQLASPLILPFFLSRHTMKQLQILASRRIYQGLTRGEIIRSVLGMTAGEPSDDFIDFPFEDTPRLLKMLGRDPKWKLLADDEVLKGFVENLIVAAFMTYQPTHVLSQVMHNISEFYQIEWVKIGYEEAMNLLPQLVPLDVFIHQSSHYLAKRVEKLIG